MRFQSPKTIKLATLSMAFFMSISCSKDTDLLADYVVSNATQARLLVNLVADDYYFISNKKSIVLDVLSNDLFENPEKVKITKVSTPNYGTVTINEDKTLTYTVGTEAPTKEESDKLETQNPEETPGENQDSPETETPDESEASEEKETAEESQTPEEQPLEETDSTQEEEEPINEKIYYEVETENEDGTTESQEGTVTITNTYGELKAFPSAEGYGKYATGGRGGYVIHVTNLNDKGPGSLRAALYAKGKRTVVFDVSGYINLTETASIYEPNITIAGQTAPGDGITVRGANICVRTSNVIIRHIRVRPGYDAAPGSECINVIAGKDNLNIDRVIIDHCSLSWSLDENTAFGATSIFSNNSIKNVTVQNCINSEPLKYYGVLMAQKTTRISHIRNLFAHVPNRIPESTYGFTDESYEFVNNIIYNYSRPTKVSYGVYADVIGNIYKAKQTPAVANIQYSINKIENPNGKASDGKVFSTDNMQLGTNPHGMNSQGWKSNVQTSRVLKDSPYLPIPATELEKTLLTDVGANVFNDPVDRRILKEYRTNTGIRGPSHESQVGGYPTLAKVRHPHDYDSDRDGMADIWELDNELDPNNPNDGKDDRNSDGYTNLEDFLHHLTVANKVGN